MTNTPAKPETALSTERLISSVEDQLLQLEPGGLRSGEFREVVQQTPLQEIPRCALPYDVQQLLNESNARVWIKRDDLQPGGAYKIRGAAALLTDIPPEARGEIDVISATTGNHGATVSNAAHAFGYRSSTVLMPYDASAAKQNNVLANGGEVEHRQTLQDCVDAALEMGTKPNAVFIHPYNDLRVIAGQGTSVQEIASQMTFDLDDVALYANIGGGGNASGQAVAKQLYMPNAEFHVAQAEGTHAAVSALNGEQFDIAEFNNACDGSAVAKPGSHAMQILSFEGMVDSADVVSLGEVGEAMAVLMQYTGTVIEPAGAVAFARVLKDVRLGRTTKGNLIAHISGGNATPEKVLEFMNYALSESRISQLQAEQIMAITEERNPAKIVYPAGMIVVAQVTTA